MAAVAIFTCKQNSHPFQERHVQLSEPVKVGRSVARARPAPNNAIFDCKVLSRNHAILWYENGKFLLQDTKSSNGTFINNQRLSKGSEESPPREIYSGDIIQFGVDVMENSRKVTHGCIIASIQLFHPDGQEATGGPSSAFLTGGGGATLQSQELYQLAQYLQEALHREQMLENKLATLQRLVSSTQDASESGWQALIDEDRLLSRLEVLENQLQTYSKNHTEDTLRQELTALQEDKYNYETTAKESLRKMLQEKLDAVRKLSELERSLSNTEDECSHLKNMCETSQKELQQLADTHEEQLKEMKKLEEQLAEAERKHQVEYEIVEKEKKELQEKIDDMVKQEDILSAKVESLQADNDFTKEQLTNMKTKMEAIKEKHGDNQYIPEFESTGVQVELVNLLDLQLLQNSSKSNEDMDELDLKEQLRETQLNIESYKSQLKDSELRLKESKETVEKLQNQLEDAKLECVSHLAKFSSLEERLSLSDVQLNQAAENTIADLKTQLNESRKQSDNSSQLATELKDQVVHLEKALCIYNTDTDRLNQQISCDATDVANSNSISNHIASNLSTNQLKEEIDKLKELLQEARESQKKSESEVDRCKRELDDATLRAKKASEEALALSNQLLDTQRKSKDKTDQNTTLQDQLNKAESTTKEVKEQILALRDRLLEEQEAARVKQDQVDKMRSELVWRLPIGVQLVWHG